MPQRLLLGASVALLTLASPLAAAPAFALAEPLEPTTVAAWALDEQDGSTVTVDSSGAGHDGQPVDVTMGAEGVEGTSYVFDGQGSIVRVPNSPDLNPGAGSLRISAYVRVPATLPPGDYNVVQKGTAATRGGAYKLEVFAKAGAKKFGFPDCAFNGARGKNRVYGPGSIVDGQWHLVVCTLSSTQAYVTVDGVDGPRAARTVTTIDNSTDLTLGGKPNGSQFFLGDLDEVSIEVG